MKRFILLGCLFACLSISACQCSDKPDIGPVDGAVLEHAEAPRSLV